MSASLATAAKANGRPPTDPAGPTGRLATWVAETTLDDVPASVRDRAKHLVLDGIGCALVGAQLPVSRVGVDGVTALDSAGDAALIGGGGRATSATSAAILNSSFIQGFEFVDYHPLASLWLTTWARRVRDIAEQPETFKRQDWCGWRGHADAPTG